MLQFQLQSESMHSDHNSRPGDVAVADHHIFITWKYREQCPYVL